MSLNALKEQETLSGIFRVNSREEFFGRLHLAGTDTHLIVWDHNKIDHLNLGSHYSVHGVLENGVRVAIEDCQFTGMTHHISGNKQVFRHNFTPHLVLVGNNRFHLKQSKVTSISFTLEDAMSIFDKSDNVGVIHGRPELVKDLMTKIGKPNVNVEFPSWISFYSGPAELLSVDTKDGRVSVHVHSSGHIEHKLYTHQQVGVSMMIELHSGCDMREAISSMLKVSKFCGLILGSQQEVEDIRVKHDDEQSPEMSDLELYLTEPTIYPSVKNSWRVSPVSMLINPAKEKTEFTRVLRTWVDTFDNKAIARSRVFIDWGSNLYTNERLVRVANVFELLEKPPAGKRGYESDKVKVFVNVALKAVRDHPEHCKERDYVSHRIGGIGVESSLARKIKYRAGLIVGYLPKNMDSIYEIVDLAVDCRNYFVHGRGKRKNVEGYEKCKVFLTDTLEFVFLASELVGCGWSIDMWMNKRVKGWHPFCDYLAGYGENAKKCMNSLSTAR